MRRAFFSEVLPELLSELIFVALLVVGVLLFFSLATQRRSRLDRRPRRDGAPLALEAAPAEQLSAPALAEVRVAERVSLDR